MRLVLYFGDYNLPPFLSCFKLVHFFGSFRLLLPAVCYELWVQSSQHYVVNHSVKILYVRIGVVNSRKDIAEAIIGLLLVFYFVVNIFVTTKWSHNLFKSAFFIGSCNFNWIACVTAFFTPSVLSCFCSFSWISFFRSHMTYLTGFLTLKLIFFILL